MLIYYQTSHILKEQKAIKCTTCVVGCLDYAGLRILVIPDSL